MTLPVAATSSATAPDLTRTSATPAASGGSFAELHAAAVGDATKKTPTSPPKGETTEAVKGHGYAEIVSGPRNGMFLNNSGNKRDGEAFLIVKRGDREFHIYGTGRNRTIYEVGRERDDASSSAKTGSGTSGTAATDTATSGTTTTSSGASSGTSTTGTANG